MTAIPGLFAVVHFDLRRRFLQSMCFNTIPTVAQFVAWLTCIVGCYFFVFNLQWKEFGAGITLAIAFIVLFFVQELYVTVIRKDFF